MYEGVSIVDYLKSVGQPTDYASRSTLASSKGIKGYAGTADQNTQLLNMLRGGATGQPIAQPAGATPGTTATAKPTPSTASPNPLGGDTELDQLSKTDRNPVQETRYQELLKQQQSSGGGGGGLGLTFNQPTINLPQLYESLYASSGIKDIETQLSDKTNAYNDRVAKIKDNPYLSEGTMTGRLSKLQEKFNADTTNIRNDIAMRKADVETKLNLQTKQFDIESNQAKQALDQFNNLLSSGALDGASGEDIANITRATGLSSSIIQSAIGVSKKKNAPKLNTQVITSTNDAGEVTAVVINQDTGDIISKNSLGAIGNAQKGSGTSTTTDKKQIEADKAKAPSSLTSDVKNNKMTLGTAMALYQQYGMTKQKIYDIYVNNTGYKQSDATKAADKARYGVK